MMSECKTVGDLMAEARRNAGAQNFVGHDYMDLMRFDEQTHHMVIFDVLTHEARVGSKGERMRLYLSDKGYEKALADEAKGNVKIITHAAVKNGHLHYDRDKKQVR